MNSYSELLNKSYTDGDYDCYGLARRYFRKEYGLQLSNYARPVSFAHQGMNLISQNLAREGFVFVQASLDFLQVGDGIVMSIARAPLPNHVGVYVGNNYMLHHLYNSVSEVTNFDVSWKKRVVNIVRHPEVTRLNSLKPREIIEVYPPHYVQPQAT